MKKMEKLRMDYYVMKLNIVLIHQIRIIYTFHKLRFTTLVFEFNVSVKNNIISLSNECVSAIFFT